MLGDAWLAGSMGTHLDRVPTLILTLAVAPLCEDAWESVGLSRVREEKREGERLLRRNAGYCIFRGKIRLNSKMGVVARLAGPTMHLYGQALFQGPFQAGCLFSKERIAHVARLWQISC